MGNMTVTLTLLAGMGGLVSPVGLEVAEDPLIFLGKARV